MNYYYIIYLNDLIKKYIIYFLMIKLELNINLKI